MFDSTNFIASYKTSQLFSNWGCMYKTHFNGLMATEQSKYFTNVPEIGKKHSKLLSCDLRMSNSPRCSHLSGNINKILYYSPTEWIH